MGKYHCPFLPSVMLLQSVGVATMEDPTINHNVDSPSPPIHDNVPFQPPGPSPTYCVTQPRQPAPRTAIDSRPGGQLTRFTYLGIVALHEFETSSRLREQGVCILRTFLPHRSCHSALLGPCTLHVQYIPLQLAVSCLPLPLFSLSALPKIGLFHVGRQLRQARLVFGSASVPHACACRRHASAWHFCRIQLLLDRHITKPPQLRSFVR
jgi:hypothetical protein